MKAKVAVLGCGRPSQKWHLPTMRELAKRGEIDFVALCDMDEPLARKTGETYGVPWYASAERMLDKHPDISVVDIVTGDPTHHGIAKMIAERGRHVMVEKPMALTLPCCDVIIDACRRNGVHFEVAENYFRMPKQRAIVELIRAGILGDVVRVCFVEPKAQRSFEQKATHRGLTRPFSKFGAYSGMCMDMGAHRLSQLRFYAQSEPTQIAGTVRRYRSNPDIVHEDWAHALIDFESGAVGIYETSRLGEAPKYCQIAGTLGGILDTDYFGPDIPLRLRVGEEMQDIPVRTERHRIDGVDVLQRIIVHTDPAIVYENPFRHCAINDWCVGHASEILSIANAALKDEPPEYGIGGRKDVEMAMAIYESSLHGMAPVQLPIKSMTSYERALHEDFERQYGRPIDKV